MRTYVSPIGFDSTRVTRPVLSRGIDSGDRIVLVRPEAGDDQRSEEAVADVERMIGEVEPDVTLSVERVPHDDFQAATLTCSDLFRSADGDLIVNFGGGARDVFLPFTVAAMATADAIDAAVYFSDIDGVVRSIELPALGATPSDNAIETLNAIAALGGAAPLPEIDDETASSKSSVARHVDALVEEGLVTAEQRGQAKHVEMTLAGSLAISRN